MFRYVGAARLELAAFWSQTRRATNCATPRKRTDFVPRVRIELTTLASSKVCLDYLISHIGSRALMQDYRWNSPASLYTF